MSDNLMRCMRCNDADVPVGRLCVTCASSLAADGRTVAEWFAEYEKNAMAVALACLRDRERNWPEAAAYDRATMTGDWSEYIMRYGSEDDDE